MQWYNTTAGSHNQPTTECDLSNMTLTKVHSQMTMTGVHTDKPNGDRRDVGQEEAREGIPEDRK